MTENRKAGVRGAARTSRQDWVRTALDTLVSEGIEQVKVMSIASKLECSRSSFYWYFGNRSELLEALLDHWAATNTKAIVNAASKSADTINFALGQLYSSWVSGQAFDNELDFAIRDWARRSGSVRRAVDISDNARIEAIATMFRRHDYEFEEADVRARIVYFTQIGYATMDQRESWKVREARSWNYLFCHTGVRPTQIEVDFLLNGRQSKAEPKAG